MLPVLLMLYNTVWCSDNLAIGRFGPGHFGLDVRWPNCPTITQYEVHTVCRLQIMCNIYCVMYTVYHTLMYGCILCPPICYNYSFCFRFVHHSLYYSSAMYIIIVTCFVLVLLVLIVLLFFWFANPAPLIKFLFRYTMMF